MSVVSISIWVSIVSMVGITVVGISVISMVSISIWVVSVVSIGISLSISRSLGNMDNSGRVGNISASSSISTSDSWYGSGGESGNSYGVGNIGDSVSSGSNWGGIGVWGSIAIGTIAVWVSISSIEESWISLSLSRDISGKTNLEKVDN